MNHMQRTYRNALEAWRCYIATKHAKHDSKAAAITFCRNILLRNAMYTWQRTVLLLAKLRVAVSGQLFLFSASIWRRWLLLVRETASLQQVARAVVVLHARTTVATTLRTW